MNKIKLLAAFALCMAYVAGIATGWAGYTLAGEQTPPSGKRGSWLTHALQLDSEQKTKIEQIWSRDESGHSSGDRRSRMKALYEARKNEVRAILTEDQHQAFDTIYSACEEKLDALSKERHQHRAEAIKKTMAVLTPAQQKRYQKLLDDFESSGPKQHRRPGDWHPKK